MIDSLVCKAVITQLVDFYNTRSGIICKEDLAPIRDIVDTINTKLDESMFQGYSREYFSIKSYLSTANFKWPFYDYNATLKVYHDHYYNSAERCKNPDLKESNEVTRINNLSSKDLIINPVGLYYMRSGLNLFDGINHGVQETKNKVTEFKRIL